MCMYCHRDDKAFDAPGSTATYMSVHLAAHGDGNAACVREFAASLEDQKQFQGSSYLSSVGTVFRCVDCGEPVRAMDSEDHCCYTDG